MRVYFQEEHFNLLEKLQNQMRKKDDQTQDVEYEKLKEANGLTKAWGEEVVKKQFPLGTLVFRNSPLDQSRKFKSYTWAKIYPEKNSPKELSFTVGIDGNLGFIIKIDTVNANHKLRNRYEEIRGEFNNNSPIISILSIEEGLAKSFEDLIEWSVQSIKSFKLSYQDICTKLALKDPQKELSVTTQQVLAYLKNRYPKAEQKSKFIFLLVNKINKEIALETKNLNTTSVSLFISEKPPISIVEDTKCRLIDSQTELNLNLENHADIQKKINEYYQIFPNSLEQLKSLCDWYELDENSKSNPVTIARFGKSNMKIDTSINRILFGAAGTGKTFNTINHALSIIENKSLEELEDEKREKLKERFDEYKNKGQIKFVTFHQSFSYEDFVEGIRAETDDQGNLTYNVKSGVFKDICEKATGISQQAESIDEIVEKFLDEITETPLELHTQQNKKFKVSYVGSGITLQCQPLASETNATYYANIGKIKSLLSGGKVDNAYNRSYIRAVAEFLKPKVKPVKRNENNQNYVLIIDEINRGNISRIFGELITLIEDSKRDKANEELSVTLPYSKKEFTVPQNVYIIGTMNSSDHSLTGLDIALRRRFTFIEMPPKPEEIKDENGVLTAIHGKDQNGDDASVIVAELLKVMNQRIEVLLDRDHCIGHANFMSLQKQPTLENLAHIFKQKIIPQLQEYFFDDWSKISLVLYKNDMIIEDNKINISSLFPENAQLDMDYSEQKKIWKINDDAFQTIDAFIKILGTKG